MPFPDRLVQLQTDCTHRKNARGPGAGAARAAGLGPDTEWRIQLIPSRKTVSAESIGNERLINSWMISGIERPLRIEISSIRS